MDYLSLLQQPFLQVKQNPPQSQWAWGRLTITGMSRSRTRTREAVDLFRAVPWLYRGVDMRPTLWPPCRLPSCAGKPRLTPARIIKTRWDGCLTLWRLLYLTEASLTVFSRAYWWNERNRVKATGAPCPARNDRGRNRTIGACGLLAYRKWSTPVHPRRPTNLLLAA